MVQEGAIFWWRGRGSLGAVRNPRAFPGRHLLACPQSSSLPLFRSKASGLTEGVTRNGDARLRPGEMVARGAEMLAPHILSGRIAMRSLRLLAVFGVLVIGAGRAQAQCNATTTTTTTTTTSTTPPCRAVGAACTAGSQCCSTICTGGCDGKCACRFPATG